jgi:hypothetical protein
LQGFDLTLQRQHRPLTREVFLARARAAGAAPSTAAAAACTHALGVRQTEVAQSSQRVFGGRIRIRLGELQKAVAHRGLTVDLGLEPRNLSADTRKIGLSRTGSL